MFDLETSGLRSAAILCLVLLSTRTSPARSATPQEPGFVFRTSSRMVLVDIVTLKDGLPDKTLMRDDFQLFDNGVPVSIKTFDTGSQSSSRPLSFWMIVQCRMPEWDSQGSGLFAGEIHRLLPALEKLNQQDTIGVAHWCDNGDAQLDLMPTTSADNVGNALELVLAAMPNPKNHDRPGELALQKTLQLIVDATLSVKPEPLPVLVFLYGDYSGMPRNEADHFIGELLETSAVAFGIRDRRSPHAWHFPGEQSAVAHYISRQTGGEYLDVSQDQYASGLERILDQLHFRYELGFEPAALDGKRHKLTVKLTQSASKRHPRTRLRARPGYVPVSETK